MWTKAETNQPGRWRSVGVSLVLAVVAVTIVAPFAIMLSTSLKPASEVYEPVFRLIPRNPRWENYADAMARGSWGRWFFNSLFLASVATTVSLFFNSMAGFAFARVPFRYRSVLFFLLIAGLLVPIQVIIVPVFVMMPLLPTRRGKRFFWWRRKRSD